MDIIDAIADFHDDLTAWRLDIHAHPELGFEETRTSDRVTEKLESFGLEGQPGLANTGLWPPLGAGIFPVAGGGHVADR